MGKYKVDAVEFSLGGDRYLGTPYSEMDCQKFYERVLSDQGPSIDLRGSNAWYRKFLDEGWVGSPEECKKKFGCVPKGATLFIHAFDGGEESKGYHDGKGNASHIGIKTGRSGKEMAAHAASLGVPNAIAWNFGDGAIQSSFSRQHVATSNFKDKTINGGWNKVGLHPMFTYGEEIDAIISGGRKPDEGDQPMEEYVEISGGNEEHPINFRDKPSTSSRLIDQIPQYSKALYISDEGEWTKIKYKGKTGYVMSSFVHSGETPAPDDPSGDQDGPSGDIPGEKVTLTIELEYDQAVALLAALDALRDEIINKVGRG